VSSHEISEATRYQNGYFSGGSAHGGALCCKAVLELEQALLQDFPLLLSFLAGQVEANAELVAKRLELRGFAVW
jgi:hypothetical protein